jgi:hypothetical protein
MFNWLVEKIKFFLQLRNKNKKPMLKHKIVVITLILSLLGVYGAVPITNAASITNAKDTLSDSDRSVAATHTLNFAIGVALTAGQYMEVTLPADFGDIPGGITCDGGLTAATTTTTARCTSNAGSATGTYTIIIPNVPNPAAAGSQTINISTKTAANAVIETVDIWVAIIDNVDVSATVSSTLTFEISPLSTGYVVNGRATTGNSATTSLAFGTLVVNTPSVLGQKLRVVTNADDGYSVTVEQDQNLLSGSGSDIDSFINGTTTAPAAWQAPAATLDNEWTYGHMGITSDDSSLASTTPDVFGNNLWLGFNGTTPIEVMYHNGPADGIATGIGTTTVAYQIEVSSLQEAGDYYNTLTYICTPTY